MLETIAIILLILWLLGMVSGQMFGGVLHALIVVALVIFVIRLLTGRRSA
ncbi:MAG TPA: lmo0937 family membrane protein [Pyrinomonadaceae bacterium]|nr:lmo0937 family membrane protein [Pyrinomonadaceae bacterium]